MNDNKSQDKYSQLNSYLRAAYKEVTFKTAKNAPKLIKDGNISYNHLLLLTSKGEKEIVPYLNKGGNVLWALEGDAKLDPTTKGLLKDIGRVVESEPQPIIDYFLNEKDDSRSVRTHIALEGILAPNQGYYYRGFSHRLDRSNPLVFPIVTAAATAAAANGGLIGRDNILASGLVARNDARSLVMGSVSAFEDSRFDRSLVHGLIAWTTKRVGVHRIDSITPSILADGVDYFRIRDQIEVEVCLSGKNAEGHWQPFLPADAQIELVMMTPALRANLRPSKSNPACLSTGPIQLPSRYGAYSLSFRYQRPGISHLVCKQPLTVQPYRYDMVPRFEPILWPFYFSWISNMVMSAVVLLPVLIWSLKNPTVHTGNKNN